MPYQQMSEKEFSSLAIRRKLHTGTTMQAICMLLMALYGASAIAILTPYGEYERANFFWQAGAAFCFAAMMLTLPRWYFYLVNQEKLQWKQLARNDHVTDEERARLGRALDWGYRLPRPRWISFKILLAIVFFENCVAHIWVQGEGAERYLVWQPEWVQAAVEWVRAHMTDEAWIRKPGFSFKMDHDDAVAQFFPDEAAFLASPLGATTLFMAFTRVITLPLVILALILGTQWKEEYRSELHPMYIRSTGIAVLIVLITPISLIFIALLPLLPMWLDLSLYVVMDSAWYSYVSAGERQVGTDVVFLAMEQLYYWLSITFAWLSILLWKGWIRMFWRDGRRLARMLGNKLRRR
ncbi:MAG: hypothetical protein Q4D61_04080 [Cardiobacteriaceae bacterium]|nr:hypothetical protein [Cardiobacteriaceae bacterium]